MHFQYSEVLSPFSSRRKWFLSILVLNLTSIINDSLRLTLRNMLWNDEVSLIQIVYLFNPDS